MGQCIWKQNSKFWLNPYSDCSRTGRKEGLRLGLGLGLATKMWEKGCVEIGGGRESFTNRAEVFSTVLTEAWRFGVVPMVTLRKERKGCTARPILQFLVVSHQCSILVANLSQKWQGFHSYWARDRDGHEFENKLQN